jgi:DNA-binding transcriptional LysR family regulator
MTYGIHYLSDDIADFAKEYPDIILDLSFSDSLVDVVGDGYDVVVRISTASDSILRARKLADCPVIACASPEYLETYGTPQTPEDLKNHKMIVYSGDSNQQNYTYINRKSAGINREDAGKNKKRAVQNVTFDSVFRANNGEMNKKAMLAGVGCSILPVFIVLDELKSGKLKWILQDYPPFIELSIYALYPADRYLTQKARLFIDMLVKASKNAVLCDGECPD